MVPTGKLDQRIEFRQATTTEDEYNAPISTWALFERAWSMVLFGTGQERREAAQESAVQTATFVVRWSTKRAQIGPTYRIAAFGGDWDIVSAAPVGRNADIHFTAKRSA